MSAVTTPGCADTPASNVRTYFLADLAPDLESAEVVEWHVKEGAHVTQGDDLLDVTTDKAAITIPAPATGCVITRHVVPGASVQASDAILTLAEE